LGDRRIGVAVSDVGHAGEGPGVLPAKGLRVMRSGGGLEIARLAHEEDGVASIVVGLPRHLDGAPNDMTHALNSSLAGSRARTALPVALQDERLSSLEAESGCAPREGLARANPMRRGRHPSGLP
jgi:putative Holliday junction resolvase